MTDKPLADFSGLTPDAVLNWVEAALGQRATNICRPLSSYINRVYDIQMEDGSWIVAKFYRPGRWTRAALQDEQDFVRELADAEIPVIAPIPGESGATLHDANGMFFALFPKRGGRPLEEPDSAQWLELGRLLARLHVVGSQRAARHRVELGPLTSTRNHLELILQSDFPTPSVRREYEQMAMEIVREIEPLFRSIERVRIHGDCHRANILSRPLALGATESAPFFLIDFDDMAMGPAVQDLWMILPGHVKDSRAELHLLLEGYETFRDFDDSTLRLIEPLRAMRMIHFTAWCARQRLDGGFARIAPDWGSSAFWRSETADLQRQLQEIHDSL
ncbi:MAG: serine/threonine protein kinase [Kiritimatiellae bacterium]|nr:serine/threonine protein kinase [Kiritimatiellia bacterium]MCO5069395.1 serine/threonine protein kinase [Kiritimatiellia bacterium]